MAEAKWTYTEVSECDVTVQWVYYDLQGANVLILVFGEVTLLLTGIFLARIKLQTIALIVSYSNSFKNLPFPILLIQFSVPSNMAATP